MFRFALLLAPLSLSLACTGALSPVEVVQVTDSAALEGVTVDPLTGARSVLSQGALIRIDESGAEISRLDLSGMQPAEDMFHDLVDLGDGSFALPHSAEVSRLYPEDERVESYFCLLPGETLPADEVIRENPGIALDLAGDHIFATPRTFTNGELTGNNLVIYRASDGGFVRGVSLPSDQLPAGVAYDPASNRILAVSGKVVSIIEFNGSEANVEGELVLGGIDDAIGATLDIDRDQLLVLDQSGTLATYNAAELR